VVEHRTDALTTLARAFSTIGSQKVLSPVVAVVVVLLVLRRRFSLAAFLIVAWGGALLLYSLIKLFVQRSRPPSDIWLTHVGATSFPSGHATQSLATFGALALVGAVWRPSARALAITVAIALAIGVAWSRVYLGVHWTTDVIAGLLIGASWLAITNWLRPAADAIEQRASRRGSEDSVVSRGGSAD
jgi:undecaprenyl-diphosphatase